MLDRLQELSKYTVDDFLVDGPTKGRWRYHEIDWASKNVPIARTDCNWVDDVYLNNEEEYPFMQFHISRALGRVVGFWDEHSVFNVVLLDPLHNIQPSKTPHNYAVRATRVLTCEYSELLAMVDGLRREIVCEKKPCEARDLFAQFAQPNPCSNVIVIGVNEGDMASIRALLSDQGQLTLTDILRHGITKLSQSDPELEPDL